MKYMKVIIVLGMAFLLSSVALSKGNGEGKGKGYGKRMEHLQNEEILTAINDGDYVKWKVAMEKFRPNARVLDVVTEKNLEKFVKMHNLMLENKYEEAEAISAELGLGQGRRGGGKGLHRGRHGNGKGMGQGQGQGQRQGRGFGRSGK